MEELRKHEMGSHEVAESMRSIRPSNVLISYG
jgi:hypothetical protein